MIVISYLTDIQVEQLHIFDGFHDSFIMQNKKNTWIDA